MVENCLFLRKSMTNSNVCIFPIFLNSLKLNNIVPLYIKPRTFSGNSNISVFKLHFLYCQTCTKMLQISFLLLYSEFLVLKM